MDYWIQTETAASKRFEMRREEHKDERDEIQKKTFTTGVNMHLKKCDCRVDDLYEDLRNGHSLIMLIQVLSGDQLVSTTHMRQTETDAEIETESEV
ncbi:PREDICTED: plectin-like [Priapulus caudatus]|uniref:Plectin-like n=1 Tax=Priapulus caudatus TaxID=37621 RepID=A0ABM1EMR3_PRICU|nr:PREDICTED: plectin-like [Priapulus caudatus]